MNRPRAIFKAAVWAAGLALVIAACGGSGDKTDGAEERRPEVKGPSVLLQTSAGDILIGFYPDEAPLSVENFLAYAEAGHYDGLVFHRVIPDFMIQAGGFQADLTMREGLREPIRNESDNGLSNERGTIAMARTQDPHSASAQFFINHTDNPFLDYGYQGPDQWGYAVFGRVLEGMDVVDAIAAVPTGNAGGMQNVPVEPVTIVSATVMQP